MLKLTSLSHSLIDWLFPSYCVQCRLSIHSSKGVCQYCLADLPTFDLSTEVNLLNRPDIVELFPDCQFDRLIACSWYQVPFSIWLTQLKFNNQVHYKKALIQIISQQLHNAKLYSEDWPDGFIILPLHPARYVTRGYNQVEQTWRHCLHHEHVYEKTLIKHKATKAQSQLTRAKRIKNLHNAFECTGDVAGKTVALIDDVLTSGATLNAATDALKKAGAKQVWAFVTCLTPL